VIYESFYGNTESIAQAIAEGLSHHGTAEALAVGDVTSSTLGDVDLLVVGAPTHAWALPRARTRAGVSADLTGVLVRDWLASAPSGDGRPAAAFATRLKSPRILTGSAATGIARRLRRRGWKTVKPASFVVTASAGPLLEGELAKAAAWGDQLGSTVPSVRAT
jgi:hypothetical protein